MGFLSRILGVSRTKPPINGDCWSFEDGIVNVNLALADEIKNQDGALRLEGKGMPVRLLVVKNNGEYHAVQNRCTHAGRRLDPLPGQPRLECCSVSKSSFELNGQKVSGPAGGSVTSFPVLKEDGELFIDLSRGNRAE